MKIQFYADCGYNVRHTDTCEVPDDTTEEELEFMLQEFLNNCIDAGYKIIEE